MQRTEVFSAGEPAAGIVRPLLSLDQAAVPCGHMPRACSTAQGCRWQAHKRPGAAVTRAAHAACACTCEGLVAALPALSAATCPGGVVCAWHCEQLHAGRYSGWTANVRMVKAGVICHLVGH